MVFLPESVYGGWGKENKTWPLFSKKKMCEQTDYILTATGKLYESYKLPQIYIKNNSSSIKFE